jgi:hypothetical protein
MTDDALDNPAMETLPPPQPVSVPGMPEKASGQDSEILRERVDKRRLFGLRPPAPSIALTAAHFTESCVGAGRFDNNCAHFLANAFVLAGYQELLRPQSFIGARCYRLPPGSSSPGCDPASKRPVRAREMDKWFDRKATRKRDLRGTPAETVEERFKSIKNTGFWAVFQRDTAPGAYWGGHVCIVDTDTWRYYGTGSDGYWYWDIQNCYQW